MFGLFRKALNIVAPISGTVIDLSQVPDATFAQKLVGDGAAIESTGKMVVSPADGDLVMIFRTNHAFAIRTEEGMEILVHIGIDTVELDGEGFKRLAEEGGKVKAGEPILEIDRELITSKGKSLITPVIITNANEIKDLTYSPGAIVEAGKDALLTYKLK